MAPVAQNSITYVIASSAAFPILIPTFAILTLAIRYYLKAKTSAEWRTWYRIGSCLAFGLSISVYSFGLGDAYSIAYAGTWAKWRIDFCGIAVDSIPYWFRALIAWRLYGPIATFVLKLKSRKQRRKLEKSNTQDATNSTSSRDEAV